MLMLLNLLAAVQTNPKIKNAKQVTQFLKYSATHTDAVTEYRRSGYILCVYLDESYISEPEAGNRAGGYFFLLPESNTPIKSVPPNPSTCRIHHSEKCDGIIHGSIMGGLFENCQKATSTRTSLAEMVHQQPSTTVTTHNIASNIIVSGMANQKYINPLTWYFIGSETE